MPQDLLQQTYDAKDVRFFAPSSFSRIVAPGRVDLLSAAFGASPTAVSSPFYRQTKAGLPDLVLLSDGRFSSPANNYTGKLAVTQVSGGYKVSGEGFSSSWITNTTMATNYQGVALTIASLLDTAAGQDLKVNVGPCFYKDANNYIQFWMEGNGGYTSIDVMKGGTLTSTTANVNNNQGDSAELRALDIPVTVSGLMYRYAVSMIGDWAQSGAQKRNYIEGVSVDPADGNGWDFSLASELALWKIGVSACLQNTASAARSFVATGLTAAVSEGVGHREQFHVTVIDRANANANGMPYVDAQGWSYYTVDATGLWKSNQQANYQSIEGTSCAYWQVRRRKLTNLAQDECVSVLLLNRGGKPRGDQDGRLYIDKQRLAANDPNPICFDLNTWGTVAPFTQVDSMFGFAPKTILTTPGVYTLTPTGTHDFRAPDGVRRSVYDVCRRWDSTLYAGAGGWWVIFNTFPGGTHFSPPNDGTEYTGGLHSYVLTCPDLYATVPVYTYIPQDFSNGEGGVWAKVNGQWYHIISYPVNGAEASDLLVCKFNPGTGRMEFAGAAGNRGITITNKPTNYYGVVEPHFNIAPVSNGSGGTSYYAYSFTGGDYQFDGGSEKFWSMGKNAVFQAADAPGYQEFDYAAMPNLGSSSGGGGGAIGTYVTTFTKHNPVTLDAAITGGAIIHTEQEGDITIKDTNGTAIKYHVRAGTYIPVVAAMVVSNGTNISVTFLTAWS